MPYARSRTGRPLTPTPTAHPGVAEFQRANTASTAAAGACPEPGRGACPEAGRGTGGACTWYNAPASTTAATRVDFIGRHLNVENARRMKRRIVAAAASVPTAASRAAT